MKIVIPFILTFGSLFSNAQTVSFIPSLLFGTESNNINLGSNSAIRSKTYKNHFRKISNKNSKGAVLEIKYNHPKFTLSNVDFYPAFTTGYFSNLFMFDEYTIIPTVSDFSEQSWLNGFLIGGSFHSKNTTDFHFFFEAGIVHKHYFNKTVNVDIIDNTDLSSLEVHISSKNKDNLGFMIRSGLNLKLNKKSSLIFGLVYLNEKRNIVNYSYRRDYIGSGTSVSGEGDNISDYSSKNYNFFYLTFGYQYNIFLSNH